MGTKSNVKGDDMAMGKFISGGVQRAALVAVLACFAMIAAGGDAMAASFADTCTDQPLYASLLGGRLDGILTDIVDLVQAALFGVMELVFLGIVLSPGYQNAVGAASILFIAFYGVSFIFGFVPANFSQLLIRLLKIGIVLGLMTPAGWTMFSETMVCVFGPSFALSGIFAGCPITTVDWLINQMILLGSPGFGGLNHFSILEPIMIQVFSPKMFIMVIGSLTTGPFGPIMAMALLWSVFNLFMMVLKALEIYLLSLILRTLLLAMAPIFFAFMFFDRTKHIFMGYINQLVSFSLQPVLLFAFLAFFVTILESAILAIMAPGVVELCYTKMEHLGKMPYDVQHWRFKVNGEIYEGEWTYEGPVGVPGPPFPINILDILVFLVLCHIGAKMSNIVVEVAAEIAQSSVRLTDVPNSFGNFFGGAGRQAGRNDMATDATRRSLGI